LARRSTASLRTGAWCDAVASSSTLAAMVDMSRLLIEKKVPPYGLAPRKRLAQLEAIRALPETETR
jgi:hypothetical protein